MMLGYIFVLLFIRVQPNPGKDQEISEIIIYSRMKFK